MNEFYSILFFCFLFNAKSVNFIIYNKYICRNDLFLYYSLKEK